MKRYSFFIAFVFYYLIGFSQQKEEITSNQNNQFDGFIEIENDKHDNKSLIEVDSTFVDKIDEKWIGWLYDASSFDSIHNSVRNQELQQVDFNSLPTDTLKSRLAYLDSKSPFNIEYNPGLESVIKSYLKKRRPLIEKMIALSALYFPMFEEHLDKYNMPLEIKYLAVVESALMPNAKSRVGATGLWQFMYGTGKMYDLRISSYVDERSDPLKSTEAACKYLSKLYEIFEDWDLALAAYNSGPGNVTKAIRRSGGYKNYWNIRPFLPRETAGYLPSFLATMYYFEYAELHGFSKNKTKYRFYETDTVKVKSMIGFNHISEFLNVSENDLKRLNPSYKLGIIPSIKDRDYYVRLPLKSIGKFIDNEQNIYQFANESFNNREKPLPKYYEMDSRVRYSVRNGDYLGKIANKFGVRVSEIKRWNGLKSDNLKIGQRLIIYPRSI